MAVLLDNFLAASNEISNEEANKEFDKMKQTAPVSQSSVLHSGLNQ